MICDNNNCESPIEVGDEYYLLDNGETVHTECFNEYASERLIIESRVAE